MLPLPPGVNFFWCEKAPFPQPLSVLFRYGYVEGAVQDLWIKREKVEMYYCNLRIMPLFAASQRSSLPKPAMFTRLATAR